MYRLIKRIFEIVFSFTLISILAPFCGIIALLILFLEGRPIFYKSIRYVSKNKKVSIPLLLGIDESKRILGQYKEKALSLIKKLPSNQEPFIKLLDFLVNRIK